MERLTNKKITKVVCLRLYYHKTMACNNQQGLEVLCVLKTMKGENERLHKTTTIYTIS
jgi:hypothetical protein